MKSETRLPYGETSLPLKIPDRYSYSVLEPREMKGIPDPRDALRDSVTNPIGARSLPEIAEGSRNPCIIVSDSTRPTPSRLIAETALEALNTAGVPDEKVKVIIATGLHRPCTDEELVEMMGVDLLRRVKVVNHVARDGGSVVYLGDTSRGTPLWVNRQVMDSDLIIGDGYIEPHFFAGYTGGGKNILPGVSGLETIKSNHGAEMIDHQGARAGVLDGNPIYRDIVEGARMAGYDFSVNVTLNSVKQVSGVFTGDFEEAHLEGCRYLERHVGVKARPADIVFTTNGGYPLDRDLYQAVKAMTVGETAVKEGGVIVVASECRDGVGHPDFKRLVEENGSPEEILEAIREPGFFVIDQWQAQTLARVLLKADVIFVTGGVDAETVRSMHLTPAATLEDGFGEALRVVGRDPEINIIPGGPSTIPLTD
ncbi:nickel-dependent lactate racemase [Candidatus Bathyarchaeota archaeon]|nr:nickel-dependent lactate racemase [Candidatus Bathyarchaeota archaeon]